MPIPYHDPSPREHGLRRALTLIETCRANGVNPFDYLLAMVRNEAAVRENPGNWMPWNYDQASP